MANGSRWVITGAAGQLGGHLIARLARRTPRPTLVAMTRGPWASPAPGRVAAIDLCDLDGVSAAFREARPSHVIHAAAVTAIGAARDDPQTALRVNVQATQRIVETCAELGARLVYTSTDMVFSGEGAPYDEAAPTEPLSVYGRTKLAGEAPVRQYARGLVVRVPLLYGHSVTPRQTTFAQQMAALRAGQPLKLFVDEVRTPVWLADAARALIALAESDVCGLIHVAGPERLSRFALIERCARLLGLSAAAAQPVSRLSIAAPEPRPADLSLDGRRFAAMFPDAAPGPVRLEAVNGDAAP